MKKRILSILLVVAMLAVMIPAFAVASSAETTVTDWNADVIVINTVDDFLAFRTQIRNGNTFVGKTVELGADIDLTGVGEAKGKNGKMGGIDNTFYFAGTFDGKFHTISNMTVDGHGYQGALFGSIPADLTTTTTVKNLAVVDANVKGSTRFSLFYAAVYSTAVFENIYVRANVTGSGDSSGGFVGYLWKNTATFKNCVFEGTVTNGANAGAFVGSIRDDADKKVSLTLENCLNVSQNPLVGNYANSANPKETTVNCYTYDAAQMGAGLTATAPAGFTALNTGYPVPATLLPFFADKVNGTAAAEGVTTEYYGYQDNGSMTALRLIGLVNGEEANFTSVGFEIVAVGPTGVTVSFVDDITSVYTSVETPNGAKTAEELGGSYIFVTEIGGIKPNAGVATFAVKTYSVDADGNKTYTDMVVVSLDTTVAN